MPDLTFNEWVGVLIVVILVVGFAVQVLLMGNGKKK